jgi:hypothetical protein
VPLYVKFVEIVFFKSLFFILKILFLNYFNIIFLINKKITDISLTTFSKLEK